jgi:hypothetical protein
MTTDVIPHMAADPTFLITESVAYTNNKSYDNIQNTARRKYATRHKSAKIHNSIFLLETQHLGILGHSPIVIDHWSRVILPNDAASFLLQQTSNKA